MKAWWRERLLKLWKQPLGPLLLLAVLAGCWGFLEIATETHERDTRRIDASILRSMRVAGDPSDPVGPEWLEEIARDLTAMGGITILSLVTLTVFGLLLFEGNRRLAWLGLLSIIIGAVVMSLLKLVFDRPRPTLIEHATLVTDPSFPSGHSMMAAMVYLTLGIMLARAAPRKRVRVFIVGIALFVTLSVGASRVYLGVHWPTDVLGGWTLGAAWAALFWMVARIKRC